MKEYTIKIRFKTKEQHAKALKNAEKAKVFKLDNGKLTPNLSEYGRRLLVGEII